MADKVKVVTMGIKWPENVENFKVPALNKGIAVVLSPSQ